MLEQHSYSPTVLNDILSLMLQDFSKFEHNTSSVWLNTWFSQSEVVLFSKLKKI